MFVHIIIFCLVFCFNVELGVPHCFERVDESAEGLPRPMLDDSLGEECFDKVCSNTSSFKGSVDIQLHAAFFQGNYRGRRF